MTRRTTPLTAWLTAGLLLACGAGLARGGGCGCANGACSDRAPLSLEALRIRWEDATGGSSEALTRPLVVWVSEPPDPEATWDTIEDVVFADEWIALGAKAFRCVRLTPQAAASDPLVAGKGRTVPRVLVVDPVKRRVRVVEKQRIRARTLYPLMRTLADRFYEERLDGLVHAERDLLEDADRTHVRARRLGGEAERRILTDEEREELDALERAQRALTERERALWRLTPREAPGGDR